MKRTIVVLVALACSVLFLQGTVATPAGAVLSAPVIDPALQTELLGAGEQDMVSAIVVLKAQSNVSTITATTRRGRLAAVEQALRTVASSTQRGILDLLALRSGQGLVASYVPLWIFNGVEVAASPEVIEELAARSDVREIRPDLTFRAPQATTAETASAPATEQNLAKIEASAMWDLGYRGQGIVVANMDTGVDATHPDLASRWRGGSNSWYDPNGEHPTTPTDVNGHGTWTMGVMAAGDAGGTAVGVAPEARWIAVKIFDDRGIATSSGIHLGYQWLLDPDGDPTTADAPNVINNSWTMATSGCNLDFQLDLRNLRAAGILPVFAAGNDGPTAGTSSSPANNPEAFAVGGTDVSDLIDPSSSRGPSACSQPVYPQLTAPGVGVRTTDLYGSYVSESGTSIAAPHVSGALALLLDAFPNLSADRQASALEGGAVDLGPVGPDDTYGYGRLDVRAAYDAATTMPDFTLTVSPSSATTAPGGSVGYTVSATAVNGFTGDVSLSLSGLTGSQGSWIFDPVVINGGSGSSQLIVTTSPSVTSGSYPLTITGSSAPLTRTASATVVVSAPPDFSVAVTPSSQSVAAGSSVTSSVGVTSINGFTGDVDLSLTGLPASTGTADFSPGIVTGGAGTSQLTISTSATATPGTYELSVVGTTGATSHTVPLTLVVTAPPDFAIGISPSSLSISRGRSAAYTISIGSLRGFAGTVTLTVSSKPSGTTVTLKPSSVAVPGSSTMTVKTTSKTTRGTYTLVVMGSSGTLVHQATTTLIVG